MKALAMILFLFESLAFAQTPALDTDQVLAKMEQASRSMPYLQANIQRTKYTKITNKTGDPQSGRIWIATPANAPRRIKVDFDKPLRELFLIDKGGMTHYYPAQKTGDAKAVKPEEQVEGECVFFGLCQLGPRIKEFYDIRLIGPDTTVDGVKATRLSLKPKDPTRLSGFALIELWLDSTKWYSVQTRVTETNGNYVNATFKNFQTVQFSPSVFNIDLKGADINRRK